MVVCAQDGSEEFGQGLCLEQGNDDIWQTCLFGLLDATIEVEDFVECESPDQEAEDLAKCEIEAGHCGLGRAKRLTRNS